MMNSNHSTLPTDTLAVSDHTHSTGTLRDTLEHLIVAAPFTQVMATMARVCHGKACDIRSTSVDEYLAQAWDFNAAQCKRAAMAAQPREPTIQLRSIKLGIEPGELQRRIDRLPEPLRVIAMDYFHGALPPAGRSNACGVSCGTSSNG